MIFKFQNEFDALSEPCPPQDCIDKDIEAYRWIFDSLEDEENFKPLAKKNPARVLSMEEKDNCKAHSLSMFDSREAAKSRFRFFREGLMNDKAFKLLGTKIAKGNIKKEHGVNSSVDKRGHFSHFQYESTDFTVIFKIIENLR